MRTPVLVCTSCGSGDIRRSKRQSLAEGCKMALGIYPFRCMACTHRFWVSVWLVSRLPFAKCPRCLGSDLTVWPERFFQPRLWRNMMITLGAHRYRCVPCRHNFASFRPRSVAVAAEGAPEQVRTSLNNVKAEWAASD